MTDRSEAQAASTSEARMATTPIEMKRSEVLFQARDQPPSCDSAPTRLSATSRAGTSIMTEPTTPADWIQSGTGEPIRDAGAVQPAKRK